MIRLAVVGDIGSGKSYVAKYFGYPVFNADYEVSKIYKRNRRCFSKLNKAIPRFIISFPIKKIEIIKAIMDNANNLKKIVKIIHPEVKNNMNKFIKKNRKKKIIVLDIPLLVENRINKKNDIIVFVDAKKREINKRLERRPGYNKKVLRKLRKLQLPLEFKKKKSNFVIKNNFTNNSIKKSVKIIKNFLLDA